MDLKYIFNNKSYNLFANKKEKFLKGAWYVNFLFVA